jgi:hypothetical protein
VTWRPLPKLWLFSPAVLCVLTLVAACGGSDKPFQAVPITCDPLTTSAYRYNSEVAIEVKEAEGPAPGTPIADPNPFRFVQGFDGIIQAPDKVRVAISTKDPPSSAVIQIIVTGDKAYSNTGSGWTQGTVSSSRPFPIGYRPASACTAIAKDLDPTQTKGESDAVHDVDAHRYDFSELPATFFANDPDFGGGSDAGRLIHAVQGSAWIADEGGYVAKLILTGTGEYASGRKIVVHLSYELLDFNPGDIDIQPPGGRPPGGG